MIPAFFGNLKKRGLLLHHLGGPNDFHALKKERQRFPVEPAHSLEMIHTQKPLCRGIRKKVVPREVAAGCAFSGAILGRLLGLPAAR